jgi:SAM-dependent methyltransferase
MGTTSSPSDRDLRSGSNDRPVGDGGSFESLAAGYNFLNAPSFGQALTELVVDETRRRRDPCRILDIGCGAGIGREVHLQWSIKSAAEELWGIEPDVNVAVENGLFDHFQNALMETADLPAGHFDVAYSAMVMEHVAHPSAFLAAVYRCLKPGGVYLFVTPNAQSFVPWATKVLHAARLDETMLRLIRGRQQIDEYHYPVQFRCNLPKQLNRFAEEAGFLPPEYAYQEGCGSHSYLRGPLAPLRHLLIWKRRLVRTPSRLATLICRMTKPDRDGADRGPRPADNGASSLRDTA